MVAQSLSNPVSQLLSGHRFSLLDYYERSYCFSVSLIRKANYRDFFYTRMSKYTILNFERMDVLATSNYEVLDPPCDFDIAVCVYQCLITSLDSQLGIIKNLRTTYMHPHLIFFISYQHFLRLLFITPVAFHDQVPIDNELTLLANA
jgi:hypothetical protein